MDSIDDYLKKSFTPETFANMLFRLIDEKGLTDADVYKKANLDRKFFSKLRCDAYYKPKKKNVIALALALELDNKTSKTFIKKAGYILTGANKFDVVIRYCFENGIYDLFTVNMMLDKQGLDTLR